MNIAYAKSLLYIYKRLFAFQRMRSVLLILFFFLQAKLFAQYNLVPNRSFENYTNCPTSIGQLYQAIPWINPHATSCGLGTPDYFNQCASSSMGVPSNAWGNEPARSGAAYAGFYTMNLPYPSTREYIEVELNDSLLNDKDYVVTFFLSLGDNMCYATGRIGAYFSDTAIVNYCDSILPFQPQVVSSPSNPVTNKLGWTMITDTFRAQGGEKYMIIGNFLPLSQSDSTFIGGCPAWGDGLSYYYIDDVSVVPLDSLLTEVPSLEKSEQVKLFPNPNDGNMQLDYQLEEGNAGQVSIYDLTGRLMVTYQLVAGSNTLSINANTLSEGTYLCKVTINNRLVKAEKVVIIR